MGSHGNGVCRQFQHRMSTGPPRTFAPASTTRNAQTEIPQQDRPPECAEILVLFAHGRVLWRRWQLSEPHGSQFWRSWTQTEESLKPSPTGQALPADDTKELTSHGRRRLAVLPIRRSLATLGFLLGGARSYATGRHRVAKGSSSAATRQPRLEAACPESSAGSVPH